LTEPATDQPLVSVVIPTYDESATILDLIGQLSESLPRTVTSEIVVVDDDSPDGTGQAVAGYIERLGKHARPLVRLVVRKGERGLGSAIVRGINESRGRYVVVMDADLSHPPSVVPRLLEPLLESQCDVAVASRHVEGGGVVGWPLTRRLASWGATELARVLGLGVRDPMSGFFAFDKRVIQGIQFYAIGYKILPEILAKSKGLRVMEIPFTFVNRKAGASKLSIKIMFDYLRMAWKLFWARHTKPQ